ncbi:MAG: hypothetical protein IPL61_01695 [Myxococcales bacterium]|nr:hypothetical protein [Myxococcales bacterium]
MTAESMPPDDDAAATRAPDALSEPTEPAPAGATSDLRGRDVLARSSEEIEAIEAALDPIARAELASWFARPSVEVVQERVAATASVAGLEAFGGDIDAVLEEQAAQRRARVAALAAVIEPWFYDRLERHDRYARTFRELVPPPAVLDPSIARLRVPSEEELATIGEPRDYVRSRDIDQALDESAPQAVLRDLYRPVSEFTIEFTSDYQDDQPTDAHAEVLVALAFRPEQPELVSVADVVREARTAFREATAPPWAELVEEAKAVRAAQRAGK